MKPGEVATTDYRSDAAIFMACGYHLSQARLQLDMPEPSLEALKFHLGELYRNLHSLGEDGGEA